MQTYLDFEKPISDLEGKIHELKKLAAEDESIDTSDEITRLEVRVKEATRDIYSKLGAWEKTQVARHPQRPHFVDYAAHLFTEFTPLAGDRNFGEDAAIQAGLARFNGMPVALIGQEKGSDTKTRLKHNFGSPRPEGYRKAIRVMEMADRFGLPIVTLIDTPGAYPGIEAEERGQALVIAENLMAMSQIDTPIVSVVIGEGGSGGALGIGMGDRVAMLEHAYYSVISPEGCATILWKGADAAPKAASALKMTAPHLKAFGIVDEVIPEPVGGAHRDHRGAAAALKAYLIRAFREIAEQPRHELLAHRYAKYRRIGVFLDDAAG
jgi:acetyl-CoA carboxylase carboxyl transferase subunit alpha